MIWTILIIAGVFVMLGVVYMNRYSESRKKLDFFGIYFMFFISFIMLTYSIQYLDMSTAYAVWTGIGAVGGALVGMLFYNESKDIKRILCIIAILGATVSLKLIS